MKKLIGALKELIFVCLLATEENVLGLKMSATHAGKLKNFDLEIFSNSHFVQDGRLGYET